METINSILGEEANIYALENKVTVNADGEDDSLTIQDAYLAGANRLNEELTKRFIMYSKDISNVKHPVGRELLTAIISDEALFPHISEVYLWQRYAEMELDTNCAETINNSAQNIVSNHPSLFASANVTGYSLRLYYSQKLAEKIKE